jgi:hypothetical protein
VFGTDAFNKMMMVQPTTWRQRVYNGETALFAGLATPAIPAVFGPADVCFTGTLNTATFHSKVEMKVLAAKLRDDKVWPVLARALAIAERDVFEEPGKLRVPDVPRSEQQFFAVGSIQDDDKKRAVLAGIGIGKMQDAIDQADGAGRAVLMADLNRVIVMAFGRAAKCGVEFPDRIFPDPDTEAWNGWMKQVEDFREAIGIKGKKRKTTV